VMELNVKGMTGSLNHTTVDDEQGRGFVKILVVAQADARCDDLDKGVSKDATHVTLTSVVCQIYEQLRKLGCRLRTC